MNIGEDRKKEGIIRLDHIAYRTKDRLKTAEFFMKAFGYRIQTEFDLDFGDGETVRCLALEPPEKLSCLWKHGSHPGAYNPGWVYTHVLYGIDRKEANEFQYYHLPPEIFVSDGGSNTIVGKWVAARGEIGGIHHLAYQVESVHDIMEEWKSKGYAEFTSETPFKCPGLTQVFTKPSELCGVIYEFIEREEHGFCAGNVIGLMRSTVGLDVNMK